MRTEAVVNMFQNCTVGLEAVVDMLQNCTVGLEAVVDIHSRAIARPSSIIDCTLTWGSCCRGYPVWDIRVTELGVEAVVDNRVKARHRCV